MSDIWHVEHGAQYQLGMSVSTLLRLRLRTLGVGESPAAVGESPAAVGESPPAVGFSPVGHSPLG